jgi:ABC-2 type transport system ATP-binding protein
VEESCDRAVLIDRGRVVAQGSMAELRALGTAEHRVVVEVAGDARAALAALPGTARVDQGAADGAWREFAVALREGADPSAVAAEAGRALVAAGLPPRAVRTERPTLEGVFLRLVRERREAAP